MALLAETDADYEPRADYASTVKSIFGRSGRTIVVMELQARKPTIQVVGGCHESRSES